MKYIVTFLIFYFVLVTFNLKGQTIIISEIMQNPDAVSDASGEWFELYNAGVSDVDIDGWRIFDSGSNSHTINNGGPLTIPAGGFLVLGNNNDTATNGGVPVDYEYPGSFAIGNSDDEIILEDDATPTPNEIDRVEYDGGPNWPDPNGASMVFIGLPADNNNVGSNWTTATVREPNWISTNPAFTDLGSPGTNGSDQSLPVELTSFVAIGGDGKVELKWVTETEVNNQGFELERATEKSGNYQLIASYIYDDALKGVGNSASSKSYSFIDETVFNGVTYWYKLVDVDFNGVRTTHPVISAVPNASSATIGVIDDAGVPTEFALKGNYPNPFNPETTIKFDIPETENELIQVNLSVYNMLGQKVLTLIDEPLAANSYEVKWSGKDENSQLVPTGIYFYILKTEYYINSQKMMLVK